MRRGSVVGDVCMRDDSRVFGFKYRLEMVGLVLMSLYATKICKRATD